ncbi:MAG: cold shock and DUF1294 domain-containing protein [Gammaproteobacteria bacterium]|nr:cold shock and DUF1294 domain-containing protein [Gammaproteobacteria bacterium]MBU0828623.1 cold shock and DUF1294 domain-containing protein [Gammaproteobacteria bacterium]
MQKQGTVIRWDATRAFGFIRSPDTSADVFFHVRDFKGTAAPREGLAVVYEEIHVGGKGPRAMAVQPAARPGAAPASPPASQRSASNSTSPSARRPGRGPGSEPKPPQTPRGRRSPETAGPSAPAPSGMAVLLMLGWVALMVWGVWATRLPLWVVGAAVAINLLTFVVYAIDKSAAQNGQWRTKESHLHLLALAGGWPGAWFAQQWLRHKSRKLEFRAVYWLTVVLHVGALLAWVTGWLR